MAGKNVGKTNCGNDELVFVHERSRRVELKTSKKATPDVVRIKQPETSLETGLLLLLLILLYY